MTEIRTDNTIITIEDDGSVDYVDQMVEEQFESVADMIARLQEFIDSGSGEWWVEESKTLKRKLKKVLTAPTL